MKPVALITGASSGIGLELARVFAAHGHELALVARRHDRLDELATEIAATGRPRPTVLTVDLERREGAAKIAAELATRSLEPAFVVNNAGFGLSGAAAALSRDEQLGMIDLNVRALTELSLMFVDSLAHHRGGILNVASIAAFLPGPGMAVYYATKAYVLSFTEALAEELAGTGVTSTAVCPGPTTTNFGEAAGGKFKPIARKVSMTAAAVARLGHRAYRSGRVVAITGVRNKVPAFAVRLAPRALVRKIAKRFNAVPSAP